MASAHPLRLSKTIFWDLDHIDVVKNKRIIIERLFSIGDIEDIKEIIQFYGIDTIKQEIVNAGFLDNKTLYWISDFLNIPKTKFKCFTKKLSNQAHWNY